jgi:DNA-binding XRE family transcriptional regulator
MRKNIKIPRIVKVVEANGYSLHVAFNNGEIRKIDFLHLVKKLGLETQAPVKLLTKNPKLFNVFTLQNGTLAWYNTKQYITAKNGEKIEVPFEIGADVLYANSISVSNFEYKIGELLKGARIKAGLTQEQVATASGTTKNYISKIENEKSDIELSTLNKIVELGLGKHLEITLK